MSGKVTTLQRAKMVAWGYSSRKSAELEDHRDMLSWSLIVTCIWKVSVYEKRKIRISQH